MDQKEIYASIELLEQEIRFVLGEFHNGRLNILNIEMLPTTAIANDIIINEAQLVSDIKTLINVVNNKMQVNVEKTIVVLPSRFLQVSSKRLSIGINNKKISSSLINETILNVADQELANDEILVSSMVYKYFVDGIAKNKLSLDKSINQLLVDVNLYSGKQEHVFQYLNVVEKSGLEIIDICFDSVATASEMAAFEASRIKNILIIKYESSQISLSLVSDGRVVSTVSIDEGYSSIIDALQDEHHLSYSSASKLVLRNNYLKISKLQSMPIFLYTTDNVTNAIYDSYLKELAMSHLTNQFNEISQIIDPILMSKETDVYITGKGAGILGIEEIVSDILRTKVKVYIPEVIGARDSSLVSNLGSLYNYRDTMMLDGQDVSLSCLSDEIRIKRDNDYIVNESENSMTNKFKELFKIN